MFFINNIWRAYVCVIRIRIWLCNGYYNDIFVLDTYFFLQPPCETGFYAYGPSRPERSPISPRPISSRLSSSPGSMEDSMFGTSRRS